MAKKLISIDFDGVLNNYNGNYKENEIATPREGVYKFLEKLSYEYIIEIYTVRDTEIVVKWLIENNLKQFISSVSNTKNKFSSVILDDRAINFDGDFANAITEIVNFKPHWE